MNALLQFLQQHQDVLNLLFGIVSGLAGILIGVVRWLRKRLRDEIRFSPATALALGYFNNFLAPAGRALTQGTSVQIENGTGELSPEARRLRVLIPSSAAGASRDGIQAYQQSLAKEGRIVTPAQISSAPRPLPIQAYLHSNQEKAAPILFDCPSALGNLVEVLNFHLGEKSLGGGSRRAKLEAREIESFTRALQTLIADHHLGSVLEVQDAEAFSASVS